MQQQNESVVLLSAILFNVYAMHIILLAESMAVIGWC